MNKVTIKEMRSQEGQINWNIQQETRYANLAQVVERHHVWRTDAVLKLRNSLFFGRVTQKQHLVHQLELN